VALLAVRARFERTKVSSVHTPLLGLLRSSSKLAPSRHFFADLAKRAHHSTRCWLCAAVAARAIIVLPTVRSFPKRLVTARSGQGRCFQARRL
jgi:hypothetical protein